MVRFKRLHLVLYMLYKCLHIAIPDVQNSFHKALAVIFAEVQYLYFRRNPSASSIGKLNVCGSFINICKYKDSEFDDVHTLETLSYMHITMVTANVGVVSNCSWLLYSTTVLALIIGTGKTNCYYSRSMVIR